MEIAFPSVMKETSPSKVSDIIVIVVAFLVIVISSFEFATFADPPNHLFVIVIFI
jgi:hypothetical protein